MLAPGTTRHCTVSGRGPREPWSAVVGQAQHKNSPRVETAPKTASLCFPVASGRSITIHHSTARSLAVNRRSSSSSRSFSAAMGICKCITFLSSRRPTNQPSTTQPNRRPSFLNLRTVVVTSINDSSLIPSEMLRWQVLPLTASAERNGHYICIPTTGSSGKKRLAVIPLVCFTSL